jgi:hypothetical protein
VLDSNDPIDPTNNFWIVDECAECGGVVQYPTAWRLPESVRHGTARFAQMARYTSRTATAEPRVVQPTASTAQRAPAVVTAILPDLGLPTSAPLVDAARA